MKTCLSKKSWKELIAEVKNFDLYTFLEENPLNNRNLQQKLERISETDLDLTIGDVWNTLTNNEREAVVARARKNGIV